MSDFAPSGGPGGHTKERVFQTQETVIFGSGHLVQLSRGGGGGRVEVSMSVEAEESRGCEELGGAGELVRGFRGTDSHPSRGESVEAP